MSVSNACRAALATALLSCAFDGFAADFQPFVYAGIAAGPATADLRGRDIERQLAARGFAATVQNVDKRAVFGEARLGWQFHPALAAELAYINFGEFAVEYQRNGDSSEAFLRALGDLQPVSGDGFELALAGDLELSRRLALQGSIGLSVLLSAGIDAAVNGVAQRSEIEDHLGPTASAGIRVRNPGGLEVSFSYRFWELNDQTLAAPLLAFRWHFGERPPARKISKPATTRTADREPVQQDARLPPDPVEGSSAPLAAQQWTVDAVGFDLGSAVLAPEVDEYLAGIAKALVAAVEADAGAIVRVSGHTDSTGPRALNLQLSEDRAASVAARLQALGVPAGSIEHVGMADSEPLASNDSAEGRNRNRRVEISVQREPAGADALPATDAATRASSLPSGPRGAEPAAAPELSVPDAERSTDEAPTYTSESGDASYPVPASTSVYAPVLLDPLPASVAADREPEPLPVRRSTAPTPVRTEPLLVLYFAVGSAVPGAQALDALAAAAVELAARLSADPAAVLEVSGHTDTKSPASINQALSDARAAAVVDQLIKLGLPGSRIQGEGRADRERLAPRGTLAGRSTNPRVELRLRVPR